MISALWTKDHIEPLLRIFAGCIIGEHSDNVILSIFLTVKLETFAFHVGITLTAAAVLKVIRLWHSVI